MALEPGTGVLLINLGTPDAPTPAALRRYLREFLGDPGVIDLPAPARWLLLELVILPRRPKTSAHAYQQIWLPEGSPLRVHTLALGGALATRLDATPVEVGMRYGSPSLGDALESLRQRGARRFVFLPLFPHSAEATTGSIRGELSRLLAPGETARWMPRFYDDPGFLEAWRETAAPVLEEFEPDHVLVSYHSLPERHLRRADPQGTRCLTRADCCEAAASAASGCYRAQCYATTRCLQASLGLDPAHLSTSFQSRLGRARWIQPYTDEALRELAERGVRRLAVLCPSFVADCLETLEEIGIRGAAQWRELGGEQLRLVPCPNASPAMADALARLADRAVEFG
jgi:ferrochelatase